MTIKIEEVSNYKNAGATIKDIDLINNQYAKEVWNTA